MSALGGSSSNRYQAIPVHDDPPLYPPPPPTANASAKGKGKGRALLDDEQGLSFGIRFTDGQTPDLVDLWVGHRETVRDLKRRIRILRPDTLVVKQVDPLTGTETGSRPRRLRLIQLGRVLPDGVLVVPFSAQLNPRRAGAAATGSVAPAAGPLARTDSDSDDGDDDDDYDDRDEEEEEEEEQGQRLQGVGKSLLGSVITGVAIARNSLDSSAHQQRRDELDTAEKGEGEFVRKKEKKKKRRKGKGLGGFSVKKRAQQEPPVWLHCSVGEPMEDEEVEAETLREVAAAAGGGTPSSGLEGAQQQQAQQLTPLQGFDRLREAGFSDQDIENLRSEFRAHAPPPPGGSSSSDRDWTVDVDDEEHQRALEEQWMSGMTGLDEAATAGSSGEGGHYYSLLKGVCAGFFVPFLPLFFFRTQVFSKRMQIAIVLGIFINLAFGFLRMLG